MTSKARGKKRRKYRNKIKEYTADLKEINPEMNRSNRRDIAKQMAKSDWEENKF